MKTKLISILLLLFAVPFSLLAQRKTFEDFGWRHLKTTYKGDPVEMLVISKKGEEQVKKPIFLFDQGSQPKPLFIRVDDNGGYPPFPFNTKILTEDYHLVIIAKPFIPVEAEVKDLQPNKMYLDPKTKQMPAEFVKRDYLDYYVNRDAEVIKFLQKQPWVSTQKLVAAGHSAGAPVVAKLALKSKAVTHVICSGGNPYGRINSILASARAYDDSVGTETEEVFNWWQDVVNDPENDISKGGDANKTTYSFSLPPSEYMQKLKQPVLISFGTKDYCAPFNDLFRTEMIRQKKQNFTFKPYIGLEHNYFGIKPDGNPDHNNFNWNKVAEDWQKWLLKN